MSADLRAPVYLAGVGRRCTPADPCERSNSAHVALFGECFFEVERKNLAARVDTCLNVRDNDSMTDARHVENGWAVCE